MQTNTWYKGSDHGAPISRYRDAVQQRADLTYADSENAEPKVIVTSGPKNWKVLLTVYGQTSVHSFVNRESGDIFKPAGFSAPAKHARGNIHNDDDGSDALDEYGVKYLR